MEIASDIARSASADAPYWQVALGPMNPPLLRGGSAAADARASQRRIIAAEPRAAPRRGII